MRGKFIYIDGDESGASVLSTVPVDCPRCGIQCQANIAHMCGSHEPHPSDVIPLPPKRRKRRKEAPKS